MKWITIMAYVGPDICRGCRVCEKVCPVYAIRVIHRKTAVERLNCQGRTSCVNRRPFHAIIMVKWEKLLTADVGVSRFDAVKILALCEKAHLHPQQVLYCCVGVRAEEVAVVVLDGTDTPEEISPRTGVRTDCTVECIQPILRLLEVASIQPKPNPGG